MGNIHLVTGYAGRSHVTAVDMASLFESLIRNGQFVMAAGSEFNAAVVTNNQIRVSDGELLMQGRHIKLNPGAYVDVIIENGEQGLLRHDLIVARYTRNTETDIEDCNLLVIKGVPAESDPADPDYITGNINTEGATENDMPLYRVVLSGLSIERLEPLFEPQPALFDTFLPITGGTMAGNIAMKGNKVTGLATPTDDGDAVPLSYLGKLKSSRERIWISNGGTVTVNLPSYTTDYDDGILIVRAGNPSWTSVYIYSGGSNGLCSITPVVENDKIIVSVAAGGVLSITNKVGYDLNFHAQLLSL